MSLRSSNPGNLGICEDLRSCRVFVISSVVDELIAVTWGRAPEVFIVKGCLKVRDLS